MGALAEQAVQNRVEYMNKYPWAAERLVKAADFDDFYERYRKPGRKSDQSKASYQQDLKRNGFVFMSLHDNTTGQPIIWWPEKKIKNFEIILE